MTGDQADPITVLRTREAGYPPGVAVYWLCPRSLAARLVADAERAGTGDVTDLGAALMLAQPAGRSRAEYGRGKMILVGIANGDTWALWCPPSPVEPVPGTAGHRAQRNLSLRSAAVMPAGSWRLG